MKTVGRTQFTDTPWWKRIPTIDDIKYEPVNWLVEPFIPIRTLVLLVGEPGTYKSWLALDLARAVATGSQFAHMKTGPAKEVLYVDMENGKNLIAHRKHLLRIGDVPNLRYWGRWVSLTFMGIGSKEMVQYAQQVRPLMIFDSLVRLHGVDENDNSAMARVMNDLLDLARKGATVVLLHHAGKEQKKDYRGATEIGAAPDIAYRVERNGRLVKLRQFKNRVEEERTIEVMWTEYGFESLPGSSQLSASTSTG